MNLYQPSGLLAEALKNGNNGELRECEDAANPTGDFLAPLREAFAMLPDSGTSREEVLRSERLEDFLRVAPIEYRQKIDRAKLLNHAAFDAVAKWDGKFPGPCAHGGTGSSKTRAAWSALGNLHVNHGKTFVWFNAKRLIAEMAKYEEAECGEEFFRKVAGFGILLLDDVDKINWQFESQVSALFALYDWIYSAHRPAITTTNKDAAWWTERMGEAHARRMFRDAHFSVKF